MPKETTFTAPVLVNKKPESDNFYMIPQNVADVLFKELGQKPAQLRIMLVLIGTKDGFRPSQKWIQERTGLSEGSYFQARRKLVDEGWLISKEYETLIINYAKFYKAGDNELSHNTVYSDDNKNLQHNTVYSDSHNTVYSDKHNTVYSIINNETHNIINNGDDIRQEEEKKQKTEEEIRQGFHF